MRTGRRDWTQRRRAALYGDQNGLCYWCEEPMVLPFRYPKDGRIGANICTIDHLRDRDNPTRRQQVQPGEQRLVAACMRCNSQRDRARQKLIAHEVRA